MQVGTHKRAIELFTSSECNSLGSSHGDLWSKAVGSTEVGGKPYPVNIGLTLG